MDQQRKLEILANSDFSLCRKIERAKEAGETPPTEGGFGNYLFGMSGASSYLAGGSPSGEFLELVINGHRLMAADYETIPFDEMNKDDPDFRFLFDYKDRLDELGRLVDAFAAKTRANGMKAENQWTEYQELNRLIGELMETDYRSQVLERNGMELPKPVP